MSIKCMSNFFLRLAMCGCILITDVLFIFKFSWQNPKLKGGVSIILSSFVKKLSPKVHNS